MITKTFIKYKIIESAINNLFTKIETNFRINKKLYTRDEIKNLNRPITNIIEFHKDDTREIWSIGEIIDENTTITDMQIAFHPDDDHGEVLIAGTNDYWRHIVCYKDDKFLI